MMKKRSAESLKAMTLSTTDIIKCTGMSKYTTVRQLFNSIIDQIWRISHPTGSANPFALKGLIIMYQPPY